MRKVFVIVSALIILLLIVILIAAIIIFGWLKSGSEKTIKPSISKEISLVRDTKIIEKGNAKMKWIGPAGGVISTRANDGTLYTLTVPPNALILPARVSLKPLSEVPFKNYGKADFGKGVLIGEKAATFNRPVFLSIQTNTKQPQKSKIEAVGFNRCIIGSRGFDPEICAAITRTPFGIGVNPGEVVLYGSPKFNRVLLNPTIPSGHPNTYNVSLTEPGFYMADKINKETAAKLAKMTFEGSSDYVNETEVLMHLAALGGDLRPFEDEISRFEGAKKDYPREILKGAIVAKRAGEEEAYKARIEALAKRFELSLKNLRSSFLPWPRYVAFYRQLITKPITIQNNSNSWFPTALATPQEDTNLSSTERFWPDGLPDFDESNPDKPENSPPEGSFPSSPPELPDYIDDESNSATSDGAAAISDAVQDAAQSARDAITSRFNSCDEKVEAIETLGLLGMVDPANDMDPIRDVLEKCAGDSSTIQQAERAKDAAEKYGAEKAIEAAEERIKELKAKAGDCKGLVKKDLSNYGMNDCQ